MASVDVNNIPLTSAEDGEEATEAGVGQSDTCMEETEVCSQSRGTTVIPEPAVKQTEEVEEANLENAETVTEAVKDGLDESSPGAETSLVAIKAADNFEDRLDSISDVTSPRKDVSTDAVLKTSVSEEMLEPGEIPAGPAGVVERQDDVPQAEAPQQERPLCVEANSPTKQGSVAAADGDCVMMEYREGGTSGSTAVKDGNESEDTSSDSSSSDDESQNTATDTKINIILSEKDEDEAARKVKLNKHGLEDLRTKGELAPEDLPPLEELKITVDENTKMLLVGNVTSVVGVLVVLQSIANSAVKPLDEDTILFLEGNVVLGKVFEVFGRVPAPWYSVRFNSTDDIKEKKIEVGTAVYYAPQEEDYTKYVFVADLKQMKGSDASWKDNNEPPDKYVDYSDDEAEQRARAKARGKTVKENNTGDDTGDAPHQKKRGKSDRTAQQQSLKGSFSQWPPRDPPPQRHGSPGQHQQRPPFQGPRPHHHMQRSKFPPRQPVSGGPRQGSNGSWGQTQGQGNMYRPPPPRSGNMEGLLPTPARVGGQSQGQGFLRGPHSEQGGMGSTAQGQPSMGGPSPGHGNNVGIQQTPPNRGMRGPQQDQGTMGGPPQGSWSMGGSVTGQNSLFSPPHGSGNMRGPQQGPAGNMSSSPHGTGWNAATSDGNRVPNFGGPPQFNQAPQLNRPTQNVSFAVPPPLRPPMMDFSVPPPGVNFQAPASSSAPFMTGNNSGPAIQHGGSNNQQQMAGQSNCNVNQWSGSRPFIPTSAGQQVQQVNQSNINLQRNGQQSANLFSQTGFQVNSVSQMNSGFQQSPNNNSSQYGSNEQTGSTSQLYRTNTWNNNLDNRNQSSDPAFQFEQTGGQSRNIVDSRLIQNWE